MFTLCLQEQTDDDDPKVCSCICNDIAVVVFHLKAYVFDHLWQNREEKKRTSLQNSKSSVRFGKGGQTKVLSRLCLFGFVSQLKEAG